MGAAHAYECHDKPSAIFNEDSIMCVVSMIGDHYQDKWKPFDTPGWPPVPYKSWPEISPVSRQEFEALQREVKEMIALLKRAQEYDAKNNEPHCETDSKMDFLRKVAKSVGIDLDKAMGAKPVNGKAKVKK